MSDRWSDWIWHDGKGMPIPLGTPVQTRNLLNQRADGLSGERGGSGWTWLLPHPEYSVIRYRYRKPPGLVVLEDIAAGVRTPQTETVTA